MQNVQLIPAPRSEFNYQYNSEKHYPMYSQICSFSLYLHLHISKGYVEQLWLNLVLSHISFVDFYFL